MYMQCRLQMGTRGSNHYHSGPRQCLQHLLKTEGPVGLTRGLKATIAREAPGNAIFFTVYEVSLLTVAIQGLLLLYPETVQPPFE